MIHSVMEHAGERRVCVHYLCGEALPTEEAQMIEALVRQGRGTIDFLRVDSADLEGLPVLPEFTEAMWYRILLPRLLSDLDRVLYLDIDTIALDDLTSLWEADLGDAYLGAVSNVFQQNHRHRPAALGLPATQGYFNSGVLLMNLAQMRADDVTARMKECARKRADEIEWPDQDVLNLVLGHRRVPLHPRWNCMNSILRFRSSRKVFGRKALREARRRPAIRHFEGPGENKPWHPECPSGDRDLYLRHLAATPWGAVGEIGEAQRLTATRPV